jgi:phage shock protein A
VPDTPEPVEAELVEPDPPTAPPPPAPPADYDENGVPTFERVRSTIEGRYATSLGATELAEDSVEARTLEQQEADRAAAAAEKLAEIRRSLG